MMSRSAKWKDGELQEHGQECYHMRSVNGARKLEKSSSTHTFQMSEHIRGGSLRSPSLRSWTHSGLVSKNYLQNLQDIIPNYSYLRILCKL